MLINKALYRATLDSQLAVSRAYRNASGGNTVSPECVTGTMHGLHGQDEFLVVPKYRISPAVPQNIIKLKFQQELIILIYTHFLVFFSHIFANFLIFFGIPVLFKRPIPPL